MVRLSNKEFQKMLKTISFLPYFLGGYQTNSPCLSKGDIRLVHHFFEKNYFQSYSQRKPKGIIRRIVLSKRHFQRLKRLVKVTRKLERHYLNQTAEIINDWE